jgi:restriction system protein
MIPDFQKIMLPFMSIIADGLEHSTTETNEKLATLFGLTDEELNQYLPSGTAKTFTNRVAWAKSHLKMAGLIENTKRSYFNITKAGEIFLKTNPTEINLRTLKVIPTYQERTSRPIHEDLNVDIDTPQQSSTPEEKLFLSYTNILKNIYSEILTTILSKTPTEFEKLVVVLLQKMGYGGEIKNSGLVTKVSNDGGIDGTIKEDILGFGRINIQAKRYKLDIPIGREDIQKFVGALAVAQSNKGVFITTSYFSKGAIDYVENLNGSTTIVLIDGKKLAEYIYDFGLGMQLEQVIEIKKLDFDFWDSMTDDNK